MSSVGSGGRFVYGFEGGNSMPVHDKRTLRWQVIGDNNYRSEGHSTVAIRQHIFRAGGEVNGVCTNEIYFFKVHRKEGETEWTGRLPIVGNTPQFSFQYFGVLPIAVKDALLFYHENSLYLIGGIDSDGNELSSVYSSPLPYKAGTTLATYNQELVDVYNGDLLVWTRETDLPITLSKAKAIGVNDRVFLIGGYSGGVYQRQIFRIEFDSVHPIAYKPAGGIPSQIIDIECLVDKNLVLITGNDETTTINDPVYRLYFDYSDVCNRVSYIGNTPRKMRNYHIFRVHRNIYLAGGMTSNAEPTVYRDLLQFLNYTINKPIVWEFYEYLPTFMEIYEYVIIDDKIYAFGRDKMTGINSVIVEIELVIYMKGNQIFTY